jgi:hypothetical protein
MPIEAKDIKVGLAFFQDGKQVEKPVSGNYAVRPVAGGPLVKVSGSDVLDALKADNPKCIFLWLSTPVKASVKKAKEEAADK